jgi:hypothetical protein
MLPSEAARFLKGEGCPSCRFGTMCVGCAGTGIAGGGWSAPTHDCKACRGSRKLLVREILTGPWRMEFGYQPEVTVIPEHLAETLMPMHPGAETFHTYANCKTKEFFILCPYCMEKRGVLKPGHDGRVCGSCNGDGKFRQTKAEAEDAFLRHASSSVEATDDPDTVLNRLGLNRLGL